MSTDYILKFPNIRSKPNSRKNSQNEFDLHTSDINSDGIENMKVRFLEEYIKGCLNYEKSEDHQSFSKVVHCVYKTFIDLSQDIERVKLENLESQNQTKDSIRENEKIELQAKLTEIETAKLASKEELEKLKVQNSEYSQYLSKKDFFKEYDSKCKEVETLRKTNSKLLEKVKKMQTQKSN